MRTSLFLIFLVLLSACMAPSLTQQQSLPVTTDPNGFAVLAKPRTFLYDHQRISIPKSAPWLAVAFDAQYKGLPASLALQKIAETYPVQIVFKVKNDPKVQTPGGALTVKDHLDGICSQANWTYTVANGIVLVSDIETRTFYLSSQPGSTAVSINLRNLGFDTAAGGARNNLTVDLDPYTNELKKMLQAVLGIQDQQAGTSNQENAEAAKPLVDPRTRIAVLPSANAVIVTARPHLMRQAEAVVADYIASTSRTVLVELAFFEIDTSKQGKSGLDLNILRIGAQALGIRLQDPGGGTNATSSLSLNFNNKDFAGSSVVFQWLNSYGETFKTFEDSVEVRNNSVASLDATRTMQYVSAITREQQLTGSITSQALNVEIDELRTGWSIHFQPTVTGNVITLRMGLSRSDLVREIPYSFDQGRVAGTNFVTDDYNRVMAVTLLDGETKLLTSLNNQESRSNKSRTPFLPWIGDSRSSLNRYRETVMLITATIL